MTWCCTEEPLLLSGHAALMSLWELCHPSLGRVLCIQPATLQQHIPREPMIWGTNVTGTGLGTALGLLSCLRPTPTLSLSPSQHCDLPQATISPR